MGQESCIWLCPILLKACVENTDEILMISLNCLPLDNCRFPQQKAIYIWAIQRHIMWDYTGDPPRKKVRKKCIFSWEFRDRMVAMTELIPIFNLKMRALRAFSA